ncbi:hypothetical protein V8C44DRAFT_370345 [Trichoderma aethiopicum]
MARSFFFLVQLCTILALTLGTSSMPADRPRGNHTSISSRGKNAKNTVFMLCDADEFEDELIEAFEDAEQIVVNLYFELTKLLAMFVPDGSGKLLPNKKYQRDRTFDEQNVLMTYNYFVHRLADPLNPGSAAYGYDALKETHAVAQVMAKELTKYNGGLATIGTPNLLVSCNEDEFLFERTLDGRNWTDVHPHETNPTRNNPGEQVRYMMTRECRPGSEWAGTRQFIGMDGLCREHDDQEIRYIGSLAVKTGDDWDAYVSHPEDDAFDEVLTFCPNQRQKYIQNNKRNLDDALETRLLNIPWGRPLTGYQRNAFETMMDKELDVKWLSRQLVSTVIHELSHSAAFTPPGRALADISCTRGANRGLDTSHRLECLWAVASGHDGLDENGFARGHMDAGKKLIAPQPG